MKRAKSGGEMPGTETSGGDIGARNPGSLTGRDGAVDFSAKAEFLDHAAVGEDHIYRVIELVGTSDKSIEDAVKNAIARAHKTIRNLRWFEIVRTSGHVHHGEVNQFQVTLKVGFTMEDPH
jgi:dodecin